MPDSVLTNAADVAARREREKLLQRAVESYRTYLSSRIGGFRSASFLARQQWIRQEGSLFVALGSHTAAAPESGAAEEAQKRPSVCELLARIEELHATCDEQLCILRAAVERNTRILTEIVQAVARLPKRKGGRILGICHRCGRQFEIPPKASGRKRFCSDSCRVAENRQRRAEMRQELEEAKAEIQARRRGPGRRRGGTLCAAGGVRLDERTKGDKAQ